MIKNHPLAFTLYVVTTLGIIGLLVVMDKEATQTACLAGTLAVDQLLAAVLFHHKSKEAYMQSVRDRLHKEKHLKEFFISDCMKALDLEDNWGAFFKLCPNATDIYIRNSREVTDQFLEAIANHCPDLRDLKLSEGTCENITHVGIQHILEKCRKLTHITIINSKVMDFVEVIATHGKKLIGLTLSYNLKNSNLCLAPAHIEQIAEHCKALKCIEFNQGRIELKDLSPFIAHAKNYGNEFKIKVCLSPLELVSITGLEFLQMLQEKKGLA